MSARTTMLALLRRLGSSLPRQTPSQPPSRHYSKLARPENIPLCRSFAPQTTSFAPTRRKIQPLCASIRAYSKPPRESFPKPTPSQLAGVDRGDSAATSSSAPSSTADESPSERPPSYEITFTCKPCKHRSTHNITKQGYHYGAVLITCPDCKNRHIISDHLGIFADQKITIEDMMRQRGELVKRGTVGGEGDVEFWDDEKVAELRRQEEEQRMKNRG